jgi:hypothetical protein
MTLARHQLGLVLALGCERVIVISPRFDAGLIAVQHEAEAAGARFHVVPGARGLVALVSAADEVFALADGLLAWPELASPLLEAGPGVLVQPIEAGLSAGFERLDLNHASAGALRVPGHMVERLTEMAADCDVFSALQRVALQARLAQRMLPAEVYESGRWCLVRTEAEAHDVEVAWIRLHTMRTGARSPAAVLARQVVRRLGPALLHAGSNGTALAIAALVVALLGLVSGWFGFPAIGFALCTVSWVLFVTSAMLGRIERDSLHLPAPRFEREIAFGWIMDAALAALMAGTIALPPGQSWLARLFAPVMLLGLARLVPAMTRSGSTQNDTTRRDWAGWLQDRSVLAAVLALAAFFGVAGHATGVLAVLYLGVGLVVAGRSPKDAA